MAKQFTACFSSKSDYKHGKSLETEDESEYKISVAKKAKCRCESLPEGPTTNSNNPLETSCSKSANISSSVSRVTSAEPGTSQKSVSLKDTKCSSVDPSDGRSKGTSTCSPVDALSKEKVKSHDKSDSNKETGQTDEAKEPLKSSTVGKCKQENNNEEADMLSKAFESNIPNRRCSAPVLIAEKEKKTWKRQLSVNEEPVTREDSTTKNVAKNGAKIEESRTSSDNQSRAESSKALGKPESFDSSSKPSEENVQKDVEGSEILSGSDTSDSSEDSDSTTSTTSDTDDSENQELPFGWEKVEDPHYGVYYIDHVNRRTQYENPVHTAKKLAGEDVTNTFPRQRKPSEVGTGAKRSASEHNMNGQIYGPGRPFFTKKPDELKGDFTRTSLVKSQRGLGFTIVGGNHRDTQFLQIKNVVENGPAYLNGKLKTGDVIVHVNQTCVLGFTHQDVVRLFQSIHAGETVQLETCRGYPLPFDPDDPNTEIVTTVAVTLPQDTNMSYVPPSDANMHSSHNLSGYNGSRIGQSQKPLLPDLARSADNNVLLNSSSAGISPSNSADNSILVNSQHDGNIPDLVSLSVSSRPPEVLSIPIVKGPMGFGFTIADSPYGQRVKQILDQSRCKNLAEGDLLLQINGVAVRDLPHQQTVLVLKDCRQDLETSVVVQRGGIPPPNKNKKAMKQSRSFEDRQQDGDNSSGPHSPGAYFFDSQNQNSNELYIDDSFGSMSYRGDDLPNITMGSTMLTQVEEEEDEYDDAGDVDGSRYRSKTPLQDSGRALHRPKTPLESVAGSNIPISNNTNKFNGSNGNANYHQDSRQAAMGGGGRPSDLFPRYGDPRYNRDARGGTNDPFQRSYSSSNAGGGFDDRWGRENVRPGQFRSRTPGPELMMSRGGPGPDYGNGGMGNGSGGRPENHRPKTPTAADMRNGRSPFGGVSFTGNVPSGRFTPNPSTEQGRQYRHPYQDFGRDFPDQYPPHRSRFDQFSNPTLNRSYTGDFPSRLPPFQGGPSLAGARPANMRQSTSFESDMPAPSSITRVPRRPPPHPGPLSPPALPRLQHQDGDVIHEEEGCQVLQMDVTLHRQESGYGFRIIGGTEEGSQVSVGHIVPGGAADVDNRLRQYDEITHVDGNSVLNASHHRVVQLMTNAALNGRVTLSIKRVLGPESAESMSSLPQYPYDVVVSRRESEGFGFVIISSVNKPGSRVDEFIGHIQDNSPAARCGRLHVGDRILAVNGVDTSGMHHKDVVALIKDSGFSVALTVGPPPDDSSSSNSQKSSQSSSKNSPGYSGDRDMNIHPFDRNPSIMQRQRINSSQGSDDGNNTGELYQVELHRGSRGFGFSIRGGREFNAMPLYVLRIADGGAAGMDGRLAVGDQILEINGINTDQMTHTEAIEIIQSGGPSVSLLMRRTNKPPPVFEGPPASPQGVSPGSLFPPNIPANSSTTTNGPISHSSPHMSRRSQQQNQQLPPPPPELQGQDEDYYNYPPPPPLTSGSNHGQPQQQVRFNTNY